MQVPGSSVEHCGQHPQLCCYRPPFTDWVLHPSSVFLVTSLRVGLLHMRPISETESNAPSKCAPFKFAHSPVSGSFPNEEPAHFRQQVMPTSQLKRQGGGSRGQHVAVRFNGGCAIANRLSSLNSRAPDPNGQRLRGACAGAYPSRSNSQTARSPNSRRQIWNCRRLHL